MEMADCVFTHFLLLAEIDPGRGFRIAMWQISQIYIYIYIYKISLSLFFGKDRSTRTLEINYEFIYQQILDIIRFD